MSKIISKEKFRDEVRPAIKAKGQKIALCHGVFDLVHPGHLTHLKQAKAAADVLVVSITAAEFVRKGPGRTLTTGHGWSSLRPSIAWTM